MVKDKRTYADRADYLKKAVAKRRRVLRKKAVEYAGGSCNMCGYDKCVEAFDFHHKKKKEKKSCGIPQSSMTRSWEKIRVDVDSCILVCANCHRELHTN